MNRPTMPPGRDGPDVWTRTCPRCGSAYSGSNPVDALAFLASHVRKSPLCEATVRALPIWLAGDDPPGE